MWTPVLLTTVLLAGCGWQGAPSPSNSNLQPAVAQARPTLEAARPVAIDEQSELLDFHLAWPAEVSAIPSLAERIRSPAMAHKAELLNTARADKARRAEQDFPFNRYEFSERYEVAGNAPRLLSLAATWSEYTGGAHPMHGTRALLWDRQTGKELGFSDLLQEGAASLGPLIGARFCKDLNAVRAKKRGPEAAPAVRPDDPFNRCPAFGELELIPQARAAGPFTAILVHADPYVAGPYVEGDYDIVLPVTAEFVAALKPAYRGSFEVQRQ
jgi:hypothetical protein